MKDKKKIDDLFREQLGNYQSSPQPEAWDNIRAALDKKKRRRVVPIWWRAAGVAALLALLLTVGNAIFNNEGGPESPLTVENKPEVIDKTDLPGQEADTEYNDEREVQVAVETVGEQVQGNKGESGLEQPLNVPEPSVADKDKIVNSAVAGQTTLPKNGQPDEKRGKVTNTIRTPVEREVMAVNLPENKSRGLETQKDKKVDQRPVLMDPARGEKELVKQQTEVAIKDVEPEKKITKPEEDNKAEEGKPSIFEAIAKQEEAEKVEIEKSKLPNRWELTPSVGPVYYSSLGNGSSIDPSFADNRQTGDVNLSYGAQLSYAISEKFSIRTGVHNVNLSYSTGGLELGTGPVSAALRTVDYGNRSTVTTAVDVGTLSSNSSESGGPFGGLVPKSAGADAFINQSIRYFEVPLELKYTFVDSRFGLHVIGGLSSLFLADSEIAVEAGDFSTVLGEANNLNSLSFTTNIGLGFDYKLGKRLKFNIEPMFKYQVNPYSDASVDFNPFYLGVYSGLSFRF